MLAMQYQGYGGADLLKPAELPVPQAAWRLPCSCHSFQSGVCASRP